MMRKTLDVLIPRGHRLESANHLPVKDLTAWRQEALVGDLANSIVREVEPLAHDLAHTTAYQLLHGFGGLAGRQAGRSLEQAELELSADHGRHRRHGLTAWGQPLQPASDQGPDSLGRR